MTCIVAVETDRGVVMGADRMTTWGASVEVRETPKIYEVGELLIGVSGAVRLGNLLATMTPPTWTLSWDIDRWVALDLIDAMREHLAAHAFDRQEANQSRTDGNILVAVRGRCYIVASDWSWCRNDRGVYAVGSGSAHAEGAIHALSKVEGSPHTLVSAALHAAADLAVGVRGPFDMFEQARHD